MPLVAAAGYGLLQPPPWHLLCVLRSCILVRQLAAHLSSDVLEGYML